MSASGSHLLLLNLADRCWSLWHSLDPEVTDYKDFAASLIMSISLTLSNVSISISKQEVEILGSFNNFYFIYFNI